MSQTDVHATDVDLTPSSEPAPAANDPTSPTRIDEAIEAVTEPKARNRPSRRSRRRSSSASRASGRGSQVDRAVARKIIDKYDQVCAAPPETLGIAAAIAGVEATPIAVTVAATTTTVTHREIDDIARLADPEQDEAEALVVGLSWDERRLAAVIKVTRAIIGDAAATRRQTFEAKAALTTVRAVRALTAEQQDILRQATSLLSTRR